MSKELETSEARQALHMIERSVGEHGWFGLEEVETLENTINELEELRKHNEPMKVIYGTLSNGLSGVICPKCKCCRVSRKANTNIKFCGQCGQKLDWSDEK